MISGVSLQIPFWIYSKGRVTKRALSVHPHLLLNILADLKTRKASAAQHCWMLHLSVFTLFCPSCCIKSAHFHFQLLSSDQISEWLQVHIWRIFRMIFLAFDHFCFLHCPLTQSSTVGSWWSYSLFAKLAIYSLFVVLMVYLIYDLNLINETKTHCSFILFLSQ